MSPLVYLALMAMMTAFGTAMTARRQPTVGWPQAAWATLVLGVLGLLLPWWPALAAAVACTVLGILLPVALFGLARRAAGAGEYGRAARVTAWLARIRPTIQVHRWQALWAAAAAHFAGHPAPAEAVRHRLLSEGDAGGEGMADTLALLTRDWPRARWSRALDVQSRALCELGEVDAGIEAAGRALRRKLSWGAIRQARYLWLAPLAFAGRVAATEQLTRLLRLRGPLAAIWRATSLAAAGRADEARALLEGYDDTPLPPALRAAIHARLAYPPTPRPVGPSAAAVLDAAEVEIRAGLRLRGRPWYAEPTTLALLTSLGAGFAYQTALGGSTNPWGGWLGRALVGGRWPADPTQIFTYGFMHFGLLHLAVNSLVVAALGPMVAAALGRVGLLAVFLGAVVGGGLGIVAFGSAGLTVGASGGAMGLLGAVGLVLWRHPALRGTATGAAGGRFALSVIAVQTVFDLAIAEVSFAGHAAGLLSGALIAALAIALGRARAPA